MTTFPSIEEIEADSPAISLVVFAKFSFCTNLQLLSSVLVSAAVSCMDASCFMMRANPDVAALEGSLLPPVLRVSGDAVSSSSSEPMFISIGVLRFLLSSTTAMAADGRGEA